MLTQQLDQGRIERHATVITLRVDVGLRLEQQLNRGFVSLLGRIQEEAGLYLSFE